MTQNSASARQATLDYLIREPDDEYRRKGASYLASHALADFRKCPFLYWKKQEGLIDDEDRPAYVTGRAAHTLILEGTEKFEAEYAVGGPVNPKTGRPFGPNTKAYAEWVAAQNKATLTDAQYELVRQLAESVEAHASARELLSEGVAEGVLRTEYCGIPCQGRFDFVHPDRGLVDLKTCDDLSWFEADARRFGYAHQMAFYRSLIKQATGHDLPVHIIAVEKKEPFRCGVWLVDEQTLATARSDNEAAIERLKLCREAGVWPTGYEEPRVFNYV